MSKDQKLHFVNFLDNSYDNFETKKKVFNKLSNLTIVTVSDLVQSCLSEIEIAFRWQKPAIISSHRVNYIGSINPDNAKHGLKELNRLLLSITKKWPDIEFMTPTELGRLINLSKHK